MDHSETGSGAGALDELPGELMMWVLIVSELLVFGAGLAAFLGVRITDPAGFREAQSHLHPALAGLNTIILITSGFLAARSLALREAGKRAASRWHLVGAMGLGAAFLVIKVHEYVEAAAQGISTETHAFHLLLSADRVSRGPRRRRYRDPGAGRLEGRAGQYRGGNRFLAHGRSRLGAVVPCHLSARMRRP
ncbi:heme-copper oxidase subunit III [Roseibium salinum]|uniref:cytochrome c oxidase subunit 3 n=1 Tax=Roseibium salinum TaxID=1604349 RepID=UPI00360F628A